MTGTRNACVIDPVQDDRWAELVERSPDASVFHHPQWLGLIRDTYRYSMCAVCIADADYGLIAGLPIATISSRLTGKRLVSVPFSDTCTPVAGTDELEGELLDAVAAERERLGLSLEVHGEADSLGGGPSERFYHHTVPLEGGLESLLRTRVKRAKRANAVRARELGLTVASRTDTAALDAFFRLHVLTRHKHGLPTQPRRFFRGLTRLFDQGLGFVLLVESDGRPIAAGIYLRHLSTLTYKYGASDPADLDKRPNDLLHLESLRIACESGCAVLDLGRTELDNGGLRRFKRELGAEERVLTYTIVPPADDRKCVRSVSGLQQSLIRRSPPVVGRLLGAAVYRHFG